MGVSPEVFASGPVLENESHGPQICLGPVAMSMPPIGGGPDLIGWDWSTLEEWEKVQGTTMGHYVVVGTYADGTLTLTRPPVPAGFMTGDEVAASDWREQQWLASWPTPTTIGNMRRRRVVDELWEHSETIGVEEQENGLVVLDVAYDDGTLQEQMDVSYPGGLVAVRSALRPVEELGRP